MDPFTGAMIAISIYKGITGYEQAQSEAAGYQAQAQYKKQIADENANLLDIQGELSLRKGDQEVSKIREYKDKVIGSQKASLAAQGIDVSSGSSADLIQETQRNADLDIITAKNNAWKEAWGYRVSAQQSRNEGNLAMLGGSIASNNTLMTGNMNLLDTALNVGYLAKKG